MVLQNMYCLTYLHLEAIVCVAKRAGHDACGSMRPISDCIMAKCSC